MTDFEIMKNMIRRSQEKGHLDVRISVNNLEKFNVINVQDGYIGFYSTLVFDAYTGELLEISAWE